MKSRVYIDEIHEPQAEIGCKRLIVGLGLSRTRVPVLRDNFDANYEGVDLVFPSKNGKDLLMTYRGITKNFGPPSPTIRSTLLL
jgi:hypothetical protein